jgi:hypothetical protein
MFLRNVGIYRRVYTAPRPRRTTLSSSPLWKPQISQVLVSLVLFMHATYNSSCRLLYLYNLICSCLFILQLQCLVYSCLFVLSVRKWNLIKGRVISHICTTQWAGLNSFVSHILPIPIFMYFHHFSFFFAPNPKSTNALKVVSVISHV